MVKKLEEYLGIEGPVGLVRGLESAKTPAVTSEEIQPELESRWEPFVDLMKNRFLWYYNTYIQGIDKQITAHGANVKDRVQFELTAFEGPSNGMMGAFEYYNLKHRLVRIRGALDDEADRWIKEGADTMKREVPVALTFRNTFSAMVEKFKRSDTPLDLELVDGNVFVWKLVMFGRPMTNLDGGIFKIKMIFTSSFPMEQPRVKVETPIFHHAISEDGILCYFPQKPTEISSHLEAIINAIQEESPRYDPRAVVRPEASSLLWGNAEQKKLYNRKLRRSAQESSEYVRL